MASGTLIAPTEEPRVSGISGRRDEFRCECGHLLRVFGGGRHRVYFEPANTALGDPVMNGVCSECGRGLPWTNPTVTNATPGTGTNCLPQRIGFDPHLLS